MERAKKGGVLFTTLLGLATSIVGLVFAASSSETKLPTRAVIGIVSVAALLTIIYLVFPLLRSLVKKIVDIRKTVLDYPKLLEACGNALSEVEKLKSQVSAFPDELRRAKLEEREEMFGDTLARAHPGTITLVAVGQREGRLFFVAEVSGSKLPPVRSRYVLQSKILGIRKGALRVFEQEAPDKILLEVTSQTQETSEFWNQLLIKLEVSETPPNDVELTLDKTRTEFFKEELAP